MGIRRSLNREMKKLGFLPEPHKLHRNPKHFIHTWTNGETRIGLFDIAGGYHSAEKHGTLPSVNRIPYCSIWSKPGEAKFVSQELVKSAVKTLE